MSLTVRIERPFANRVILTFDYHVPKDADGGPDGFMKYLKECKANGNDILFRFNTVGVTIDDKVAP